MKKHFESIGFKAELVDLGPGAGNGMFACNKPDADHYDVLFNAHMDTVFPDGEAAARPLTVKGDEPYGPAAATARAVFWLFTTHSRPLVRKILKDFPSPLR